MNEQKSYRAIPTDGEDFVYGWYCEVLGYHCIIPDDATIAGIKPPDTYCIIGFIEVTPETVGQQVGKVDKNEEEIYKGDIVTYKVYTKAKHKFSVLTMVWIWSEYHCGFSMKVVGGDRYVPPVMIPVEHEITIIGNVHQNPKLLERT